MTVATETRERAQARREQELVAAADKGARAFYALTRRRSRGGGLSRFAPSTQGLRRGRGTWSRPRVPRVLETGE